MFQHIEQLKRQLQWLINYYHLFKAIAADCFYGFPAKKIKVIGVSGTDGKTTTAHLVFHVLEALGKKTSMISSVYAKIGDREFQTGLHTTTPDAVDVQRYLRLAVDSESEYFVLETTSHALDQNRVFGVNYEASVITNVTPEHLDYHKTYDRYVKTKAKVLLRAKSAVINRDDDSYTLLSKYLNWKRKKYLTYGFYKSADFSLDIGKILNASLTNFNQYNYLAAYSVLRVLGYEKEDILKAVETFKLPEGRFEIVQEKPFSVIIDFAHTPNSIRQTLKSVKKSYVKNGGALIHVFGSAGLRDSAKRPIMGEASADSADIVVLTEEDYRTEDPQKICLEIAKGLKKHGFSYVSVENIIKRRKHKKYTTIIKREDAIKNALQIAKPGDVVIFTGKSHEKSLCRGKTEYPWDEKGVIMSILKSKKHI